MLALPQVKEAVCIDSAHVDHIQEETLPVFLRFAKHTVRFDQLIERVDSTHAAVVVSDAHWPLHFHLLVCTINLDISCYCVMLMALMYVAVH